MEHQRRSRSRGNATLPFWLPTAYLSRSQRLPMRFYSRVMIGHPLVAVQSAGTSYTTVLPLASPKMTFLPSAVHLTLFSAFSLTLASSAGISTSLITFQNEMTPAPSTTANNAGCTGDHRTSQIYSFDGSNEKTGSSGCSVLHSLTVESSEAVRRRPSRCTGRVGFKCMEVTGPKCVLSFEKLFTTTSRAAMFAPSPPLRGMRPLSPDTMSTESPPTSPADATAPLFVFCASSGVVYSFPASVPMYSCLFSFRWIAKVVTDASIFLSAAIFTVV